MSREETKKYLLCLGIPGLTKERFGPLYWDLSGLDLRGIDLSNTKLYNCDFRNTNLSKANLYNTNCRKSLFNENSKFCDADLRYAKFDNSDCRGVDFSGAKIKDTSFYETRLEKADFSNTNIGHIKKNKVVKMQVYQREIVDTPIRMLKQKIIKVVRRMSDLLKFYTIKWFH